MIGCYYRKIPSEEPRLDLYMQVLQPNLEYSRPVKS